MGHEVLFLSNRTNFSEKDDYNLRTSKNKRPFTREAESLYAKASPTGVRIKSKTNVSKAMNTIIRRGESRGRKCDTMRQINELSYKNRAVKSSKTKSRERHNGGSEDMNQPKQPSKNFNIPSQLPDQSSTPGDIITAGMSSVTRREGF
mmetsp:Transcript_16097/g.24994  ORF Transcript_16097/g.24994 Transcript_16097/m.24994 type:complete len:148 (+) Transcript_16097:2043-2486(+)